ncbi:damage-inducible protein DinB [Mucilaginibacter terrigena]|uniref:Damage-inducible protein DinB n=1 Tax=Mucilaginibacter terrigena TaxID=2492395 RepID=A0A4Q5LQ10_9SPHI|nr:DinB family protein [Mucilaginibacter terrigena]RYU91409.1 damage-inducible protein DinB [Mucilaginibacter terrigena]
MNDKILAEEYMRELEAETPSTQKCLERIPPELFGWKPHEKSMELGYLTLLVAEIPLWIAFIARDPEIDFATFKHIDAKTTKQVLEHFHNNLAEAKQALQNITEGDLDKPFELKANGQTLFSSTKKEQISSTLNHWVHHRGQLTVYMRLNNIAVPSIYGPSADDKTYGEA